MTRLMSGVAKVMKYPSLVAKCTDMGSESLDIPKFRSKNLDMGRESLDQISATHGATYVQTFQTLCPDFSDHMYRLSRLKLSAQQCNLGLNPDAVRPLARLMSRLFRFYAQTFQTQTLGAAIQFGSGSGCGATRGAQSGDGATFQTKPETA